ncbi:UBX domain-containing protein, putative [Eimeria acervulina]|uniref:UBX domain-containing protein, putative n=1 Tax=Eimeria acervulina TaxID=5801 RepID=U6GTM8_EIMAC|nr:UBX domain-containing protein, putative [Eimeria acervulina]CDI82638.1 UBX domain-containing protein, putative [Eimeria acervulina]
MAIRSLADLRETQDEPHDDSSGTSSFAGGERSGLAIQNPSAAFPSATRGAAPAGSRRVTLYANGFTVDDGPFREFGRRENDVFIEELKAGVAPKELQQGGRQVHVLLDDRHEEKYTPPPPPQYVLFGGEGQSLSGDRPSPSGAAAAASSAAAVDISRAAEAAAATAAAAAGDPSVQQTQILFRFHDGQRVAQHFPVSTTVQQLLDFVQT